MNLRVKDVIQLMDRWASPDLAESWDHVGLQVGHRENDVHRILVSLDVTEENSKWAADHGIDLIISHHPFLFKALQTVDMETEKGRILETLVKSDVAVFSAHTNLDTAQEGVNDALADVLDISGRKGLVPVCRRKDCKMTIVMPQSEADRFELHIRRHLAQEIRRIVTRQDSVKQMNDVCLEITVSAAGAADLSAELQYSYETAYFDRCEIDSGGTEYMMGRIGHWKTPKSPTEAFSFIKEKLGIPVLKYCGKPNGDISTVAVLGGAGAEFASIAKKQGADLYITGDVKYHEAQEMNAEGMLIVDGGHFYTERIIVPYLSKRLRHFLDKEGYDVEILEDHAAKDVFCYI